MDQPLDFSFHKGNPLAVSDELESPKPMPKSPPLPITTNAYADHLYGPHVLEETLTADERVVSSASVSKMAVEGIEALSISTPAILYSDRNAPFESATRHTAIASDGHNAPSVSAPLVQPVAPAVEQNVPFVSSVPKFVEPRVSPPKPRPRAKVPLERGFTQMDWLKLTRTASDLAGLKGHTSKRLVLMEEVRQHKTNEDAWTVLRGRVYDISPYLRFHPGGTDMLMKGAGKDCTTLFNKYHSWVNAEFLLEKCLVGYLDVEQQRDLSQL